MSKQLLTKTEKKVRIRTAKRVKTAIQKHIPVSDWGFRINRAIVWIEKVIRASTNR